VSAIPSPRYAVEVDSLVKEYRDPEGKPFRAVDSLTFNARAGVVFGLLGPNGAGKTTALRMLSTLITPTSGDARLGGYSVLREPSEVRRNIGFLTGSTGLYPRLTAREVVRYFARMYGMPGNAVEARIDSLFKELRIDFPNKRCGALSTGMKQRVSIARAIVHDPPILILDEPTTGLDVLASKDIVEFIKRSRDAGKCVIFSTHIMSEAERLCDDVAIIHRGRIVAAGTVDQLRRETGETKVEDVFLAVLARADAAAGVPAP
jgi:sodium transport system ATP-binding protein